MNKSRTSKALGIVRRFHPTVEEVVDATTPLEVEVTKKDSNSASVKNHKTCALAVACQRKAHADGMIISISTAYVIKGKKAIRYAVPPSISREIVSFDRKAGFSEGRYNLNPFTGIARLGVKDYRNRKHRKSKGGKEKRIHITDNIREHLGA